MTLAVAVLPAPRPIGALTIGVTVAGLALVAFGDVPRTAARAAARLDVPVVEDARATAGPAAQLREYLAGDRRVFTTALDRRLAPAGHWRVLDVLAAVPFGATVTYGELAVRSGLGTGAARGVGAIMGANPVPVVVPCHRVMGADGLDGFGGGRPAKEWLLALEGALTPALEFDP